MDGGPSVTGPKNNAHRMPTKRPMVVPRPTENRRPGQIEPFTRGSLSQFVVLVRECGFMIVSMVASRPASPSCKPVMRGYKKQPDGNYVCMRCLCSSPRGPPHESTPAPGPTTANIYHFAPIPRQSQSRSRPQNNRDRGDLRDQGAWRRR